MLQNCQFSFKNINRKPFSFYCLIYMLFINCCLCKAYDNEYTSNLGNEKSASIDPEEIIRRRNVAESYLKQSGNEKKDWIEPYHESFSRSSVFTLRKATQQSSQEHRIHVAFPLQNEDLPLFKKMDDSVHKQRSLFNKENSDQNSKYEKLEISKNVNDQILPDSVKSDKVNQDTVNSEHDKTPNSCVSTKISESCKIVGKHLGKNLNKSRTKTNKLKKIPKVCETSNDSESDSDVNYLNFVENDDLTINKFKNLSVDANKFIQVMLKKSELTFEKYFINGETLTLTEFCKLQENLASLSFLQRSKNNVYSINRMNIIDSIGKVIPLFKQDELSEEKPKKSFGDNDITTEHFHYKDNNVKKCKIESLKRVGHTINSNAIAIPETNKDAFFLATRNNKFSSSLERSGRNDFSRNSEIQRRKKMMNSFMATLNNNQENWIESYHLNDFKDKPERKSTYNLLNIAEQNYKLPKGYSQERLYIIRWINKLQNKLKDSHTDFYSLSVLVSADLNKILSDLLSQEFDIVMFDELVNNIISNVTFNNYANPLHFGYGNISNTIFLSLNSNRIYIFITFLFCSILLYNVFKTRMHSNFILCRGRGIFAFLMLSKWNLLIVLSFFSLIWHGFKMYQQKIAEKHSLISHIVPSYCESILEKESGVLAHIKESFRHWWHNEDCKKYYEAVMVDPSSEINPFSISTDLLADVIFQMLHPFARNMNSFFKALTYDLSFSQKFFIIIVAFFALIIILYFSLSLFAFRLNYKVSFPFHLGSIEPTEFCKGSRVEEVEEKHFLTDFSTSCDGSPVNYNKKTENKKYTEDIVLKENTLKIEPKYFKLDQSKHSVLKGVRIRRNSF